MSSAEDEVLREVEQEAWGPPGPVGGIRPEIDEDGVLDPDLPSPHETVADVYKGAEHGS